MRSGKLANHATFEIGFHKVIEEGNRNQRRQSRQYGMQNNLPLIGARHPVILADFDKAQSGRIEHILIIRANPPFPRYSASNCLSTCLSASLYSYQ